MRTPIWLWCSIALLGVVGSNVIETAAAQTTESQVDQTLSAGASAQSIADELVRVQNLIRANVLGLAERILETRGPALQPSKEWLQWERQVWALYRQQGAWQKLHERANQLPPTFPRTILQEAALQSINALIALKQGEQARQLIRSKLLATDASQKDKRQLRQAVIAAYVADDLLPDARIAMDNFRKDFGSQETEWLLLSASVLLRTGDLDAAINLLAPMDHPTARVLRLYARLGNQTMTSEQVITNARKLQKSKENKSLAREIQAVITQATQNSGKPNALVDAIEMYLLMPPSRDPNLSRVFPQFTAQNLFDAYTRIAEDQGNKVGLLVGDEKRWLNYAKQLKPTATVLRKSLFAFLALGAKKPRSRQAAIDAYVDALIDSKRTALIPHLFGEDTAFGKLSLGGETGLRLSARALQSRDFQLAADANANLSKLPSGVSRTAWLLQAGRIDILANRYKRGVAKLDEWIASFKRFNDAQTIMILQPIFDLQTVQQHDVALELLYKVNKRAPAGKHRREIAYWLAESYVAKEQYTRAADLFLHSALQSADGLDLWGEASRFRAGEALVKAHLFTDARQVFEDMLARATTATRRNNLKQKLQQLSLLESNLQSPEHDE